MEKSILKILIIEDDASDLMFLQRAIRDTGYMTDVLAAESVSRGIELCSMSVFDCIFLDYTFTESNGLEFLKQFRERGYHTPVIMVTSVLEKSIESEALRLGAFDYMTKNLVTADSIGQAIRYALKINNAQRQSVEFKKALIEIEQKLEAIVASSPLIFFSIDNQGMINMFRGNGVKRLGIESKDIVGKSIFDVWHKIPLTINDYMSALLGKESMFKNKHGQFHFESHYTVIRDSSNEPVSVIGVVMDITDLKNTEEELVKTLAIAQESTKIKEQFLANMSHEIRTPIHGIISLVKILSGTALNEEQKKYLDAVQYSADNLMVIINDILDISKIEAGKMTFEEIPFSIKSIAQHAIDLFNTKAQDKGILLELNIVNEIPKTLLGDEVRLSQVLNNLISNAVKFTHEGKVTLSLSLEQVYDDSCVINICVRDTGIGIPKDKVSTVFECFTQTGDDITRKYGGTGLGLSIVKRITELQGGTIAIESELGKGTAFIVKLPYTIVEHSEIEESIVDQSEDLHLHHTLNVLVVEDNPINQMILQKILNDWGATIFIANNGLEAVELMKVSQYDIILMDIEMPEMNGYEATKAIRTLNTHGATVPIMAMTAHASSTELEKYKSVGMNDYMSKPFNQEDLKRTLLRLTGANLKMEDSTAVESLPMNLEVESSQTKLICLDGLRAMSDDNEFIKDFIVLFMENMPDSIAKLKEAIGSKDWHTISQIAHKIKPSFSYLGMKDMHALSLEIETNAKQGVNLDEIPESVNKVIETSLRAIKELEFELTTLN